LLTPALKEYNCGALIVHHTNKFSAADRDAKKKANDFAYAGTGSAEWANWARGVLVLQAKNDIGLRELRIGKRARLGWKDVDGHPTFVKILRQSPEGEKLFFTELTPEEADETLLETPYEKALRFLPEPDSAMEKKARVGTKSPFYSRIASVFRNNDAGIMISILSIIIVPQACGAAWVRAGAPSGASLTYPAKPESNNDDTRFA